MKRNVLFIGGGLDGKFISVEDGAAYWKAAVPTKAWVEHDLDKPLDPHEIIANVETYRRERIIDGHRTIRDVYVFHVMNLKDALERWKQIQSAAQQSSQG